MTFQRHSSSDSFDFPGGEVLLIDKPPSWTSFDVVNKIRKMLRKYLGTRNIKVGHAGTLDPLATGLLIVCTGTYTRRISEFTEMDKEYTGTFIMGAATPSYDMETEVEQTFPTDHINEAMLESTARLFKGEIMQLPPLYSAVKVGGRRAYHYARKKEELNLSPRKVSIHTFELTGIDLPEVGFRVVCSKGTYIRSLIHDFGRSLNSGAYLKSLRRTSIGPYKVIDAYQLKDFEKILFDKQQSD